MESEEFGSALKYFAVDIEELVVILTGFNLFLRVRALISKHLAALALIRRSLLLNGDYVTIKHQLITECFQALTVILFVAFLKEKIKI